MHLFLIDGLKVGLSLFHPVPKLQINEYLNCEIFVKGYFIDIEQEEK